MGAGHSMFREPDQRGRSSAVREASARAGRGIAAFVAAALAVLCVPQPAHAQSFPSQPIRIILPFGPGGAPDVLARIITAEFTKKYGVGAIVENRPGANGQIAAKQFKSSAADGHTLFIGNTGVLAINPSLYTNLSYDPTKDFVPITQMIEVPFFIYAHTGLKVNTVTELMALLKAKPGVLNYGSSGHGSVHHMCSALFLNLTKLDAVHVPYKTSSGIPRGMMGDEIELACSGKLQAQQIVDAGKAKPMVVALDQRSQLEPEVPTLREITGIEGFEIGSRIGMLAPTGTPPAIVEQLSNDIAKIIQTEKVKKMLAAQGVEVVARGPKAYAALIRREQEQFARLVKLTGAQVQN